MKIIPHQDYYGARLVCSAVWADEPVLSQDSYTGAVVSIYWWRIFQIYDFRSPEIVAIPNTFGIRYNSLHNQPLRKFQTLKDRSSYDRDLIYPHDLSAWQTKLNAAMIFVECHYSIIQKTLESCFPNFNFNYWGNL